MKRFLIINMHNTLSSMEKGALSGEALFRLLDKKISISSLYKQIQERQDAFKQETKPGGDEASEEVQKLWKQKFFPVLEQYMNEEVDFCGKCLSKEEFSELMSANKAAKVAEIEMLYENLVM